MEGILSKRDIAILAIRIAALYFFITAIALTAPLLSSVSFLFTPNDQTDFGTATFLLSGILSLIIYFLAAGVLWRYAPKLADLILPRKPESTIEPGESNLSDIQPFCISSQVCSPQRTFFCGSGFRGLSAELSQVAVTSSREPAGARDSSGVDDTPARERRAGVRFTLLAVTQTRQTARSAPIACGLSHMANAEGRH